MNKVSSILGVAAVLAIALVFIVQFQPAGSNTRVDSGPACVAEIQGKCIPASHFKAAQRLLSFGITDAGRLKAMGFRKQVAEGLVEQWLLNQDAKRLGLTVSDDDVSSEIVAGRAHISLPVDKLGSTLTYSLGVNDELVTRLAVKDRKTKRFDTKTYEKDVRLRTLLSPTDFREYQKHELIASRVRDLVRERVRVGENEAFEQFSRDKSTATLDFVRLDRRFYAELAVDASPKAVDEWAAKNKEEIEKTWEGRKAQFLPECRTARHILIRADDTSGDEKIAAAKKKIERALERINAGEDFADVARKMSDDGSAARGGELGCLQKGKMVKPFEDALMTLGEGKLSGIVQTEYGFHIIKVEKIAKDAEAEKIGRQQTTHELYVGHQADRMTVEAAQKILAAVRGGKTLKDALQAHIDELLPKGGDGGDKKDDADGDKGPMTAENHPARPTIETTLPFTMGGDPIQGVRPGVEVTKLAFALQKPGDVVNDVIPLETGYAVLQLKEKAAASKDDWEKQRETFVSAMRANKQKDALMAYVQRLRTTLASNIAWPNPEMIADPKSLTNDGDALPEGE